MESTCRAQGPRGFVDTWITSLEKVDGHIQVRIPRWKSQLSVDSLLDAVRKEELDLTIFSFVSVRIYTYLFDATHFTFNPETRRDVIRHEAYGLLRGQVQELVQFAGELPSGAEGKTLRATRALSIERWRMGDNEFERASSASLYVLRQCTTAVISFSGTAPFCLVELN